ncbi:MAG TPA: 50S ribosomal protein L25, partial [Clostridia bacterium]|nr:50S ribosomal protein L25 [Clostridia bacterium]
SGQIVKVVVNGEGEHNVLIREYQRNPLTQKVIHLDMFEVSMTEKLTTVIPLVITGKAKGVADGGVIQFDVREIEIECLPTDIVEGIEVDVSELDIGDIIKVAELESPPGITILAEPEQIIVGVVAPHYEEEEEEEELEGEIEGEETEETAGDTPEAETETEA